MDLSEVAATHLYKTMLKAKRIAESGMLPGHVGPSPPKEEGGDEEERKARGNVTARLYGFKIVKENLAHVMAGLYSILGLEMGAPGQGHGQTKTKATETKDEEEEFWRTGGRDRAIT